MVRPRAVRLEAALLSLGKGRCRMPTTLKMQRVDPLAYNTLAHALAVVYWYKNQLARFLRAALRDGCIFLRGASFQGVSVIQCLRYLLPGGHERQYRAMILEPAPEPADPATGHRPDRPPSDRPHLR